MATKVSSSFIGNGAISAIHLAADAVETAKIADAAVTEAKLADGSVVAAKIGAEAVGESAIGTGAVTATKLGAGAVEETAIAADAVTTAKIIDGAITSAKLDTGAVDTAALGTDAVTSDKIAAGSVTAGKIDAAAVGTTELADGSVTAEKLSGDVLAGVLASKLTGRSVMSMIETSPANTSVNVKALLGFDVAAGVDGAGAVKGKVALLEGTDINLATHQIADGATQVFGRVKIASLSGNEILDATGNEVWGVITCSARTTGGTYRLRFYSGVWGDVCAPYTMAEGFLFSYKEIFDLDDMPTWGDDAVFVDKGAAVLAPGQVDASLLASDAVTTDKIADGAVTGEKLASGLISSSSLSSAVKARIGGGWDAITKFVGDGTTTTFDLGHADVDFDEESVLVVADGVVLEITEDFTFSSNSGTGGVDQIVFTSALAVDVRCAVRYRRTSL
jgi:hypothetical protein